MKNTPGLSAFLSDEEIEELDECLLFGVENDEAMTLESLDGYLHALAIAPVTIMPSQWLPAVWGEKKNILPLLKNLDEANRILSLVLRLYNGIIAGLEEKPPAMYPLWSLREYKGKEYEDAEGWAMGFVEGLNLAREACQPWLDTPEGKACYEPIDLLGEPESTPERLKATSTPLKRAKLSRRIPQAVLTMYQHWLPLRRAIVEREVAKSMQPKVGRNDTCPCGSGKKFKKCCGAASVLH